MELGSIAIFTIICFDDFYSVKICSAAVKVNIPVNLSQQARAFAGFEQSKFCHSAVSCIACCRRDKKFQSVIIY